MTLQSRSERQCVADHARPQNLSTICKRKPCWDQQMEGIMRGFKLLISAALLACTTSGPARADTISFFDVSGLGSNNYSLIGGLSIDVTTGVIQTGIFHFAVQGAPLNGGLTLSGGETGNFVAGGSLCCFGSSATTLIFDLPVNFTNGSLIDYSGGLITEWQLIHFGTVFSSGTGNIAFNHSICTGGCGVAPVPLPAALPLFASGLAGLGWLVRRKKRGHTTTP